MIGEHVSDKGVQLAHNGYPTGNKVAQGVIINRREYKPVDILGEGYVLFLFLVSLDVIEFGEDEQVEEQYEQHAVEVSSPQDEQEGGDHVDGCSCSLVEVGVQFGA